MRSTSFSSYDIIPEPIKRFTLNRVGEVIGILLLIVSCLLILSLASWSVEDPSWDHATLNQFHNFLGRPGAVVADLLMQVLGLASLVVVFLIAIWGCQILRSRQFPKPIQRLVLGSIGCYCVAGLASALPLSGNWPLSTGLGGIIGDSALAIPHRVLGHSGFVNLFIATLYSLGAILCLAAVASWKDVDPREATRQDEDECFLPTVHAQRADEEIDDEPGVAIFFAGLLVHLFFSAKSFVRRIAQPRVKRSISNSKELFTPPEGDLIKVLKTKIALPIAVSVERREPILEVSEFNPDDYAGIKQRQKASSDEKIVAARIENTIESAHSGTATVDGRSNTTSRRIISMPQTKPLLSMGGEIRLPIINPSFYSPSHSPSSTVVPKVPLATSSQSAAPKIADPMPQTVVVEQPLETLRRNEATTNDLVTSVLKSSLDNPQTHFNSVNSGSVLGQFQAAVNNDNKISAMAAVHAPYPQPFSLNIPSVSLSLGAPIEAAEDIFALPEVDLLAEPKNGANFEISEEILEENARVLEGVLDDFGVRGEIIHVRPGPVVTLYELEPAPGTKSSRVIGLADDIARSMSAISARVAVVQGRNAIGIELPNQFRETVFLRELIGNQEYCHSKHSLAIALGKTIGGEPVIVDLARMPHLLVAGTTGSGKSVAINTMILSLLYRLSPDQCRLIMIDPKMLELSVYDGIPHLLTPVVTDPKKAVVALKWAVREMESRYKNMAKLGVRNIDGFNAKILEAQNNDETIIRTVQTGYDRHTGEPTFEQEEMSLKSLPYIVVIVDEMADLMMVAGKDIEGTIQRLAQMARAAGIHLIMATQRPSVDVITGTIKANFPTRISFQVTSKIDSRTILGEQGAEQLLGQGDMLYMAGGGRISRVHGPFVSDGEVEKVVAFLKTQGQPDYLDSITSDDECESEEQSGASTAQSSMDLEESGDLYDRAIAIVLRDRKCSTSYIQRRLSVGYNKAASLVERMEREGVVGAANHAGKREILVGGGVDRGAFEMAES